MITQEELKEILDYNSETGVFVWRKTVARSVKAGSIAGVLNSHKYRCITIKGVQHKAHRLAFLYQIGRCPIAIDHIDGNRDNNAITNLRETTCRDNGRNRREHREGKGIGYSLHKPTGKYRAQIQFAGKNYHIGLFLTEKEATDAYHYVINNLPTSINQLPIK